MKSSGPYLLSGFALAALSVSSSARATITDCTAAQAPCIGGQITSGTGGNAVYAESTGGTGIEGLDTSTGTGVYGLASTSGTGVFGAAGTGGYGVYGTATNGYGVYGDDTGTGNGVYGKSSSGAGVEGYSTSYDGVHGETDYNGGHAGVSGTYDQSSGAGYGVYGRSASTSGWGVYSNGNFDVQGSIYVNALCYYGPCTSDARLKQNVASLNGSLDRIARLRPVTFEWISPDEGHQRPGTQTGFIAQEVEQVYPEWVDVDAKGFRALDLKPMEVTATLVDAIRTLKSQNDQAQVRATKAEAQLAALEERMNALEAGHPHTVATNMGVGGAGLGLFGLAIGGVFVASRRKREDAATPHR